MSPSYYEDNKFIPSYPAYVIVHPEILPKDLNQLNKNSVSRLMSVGIIDGFEIIYIQKHHV